MLEATKSAFKVELTKSLVDETICSEHAKICGTGAAKVLKALKMI